MEIKIYQGNALEVLKDMDSESVDMCMTSPPYWGLRDYGEDGQLGLEPTYYEYIDKLIAIFDEVRRVLKDTGTCWVNLGDTYSGGDGSNHNGTGTGTVKQKKGVNKTTTIKFNHTLKTKSLIGIPERFCIAMTDRGWIRRNTIIWHKPNCMPSSADDRFTVDFEYLYFFTKSKKYWFEPQFEEYAPASDIRYRQALRSNKSYNTKKPYSKNTPFCSNYKRGQDAIQSRGNDGDGLVVGGKNSNGRNMRTVWKIPTRPYPGAHFATYPEELCYVPIKAGCPKGGTVLDPFMGSGTTLKVARDLGRNGIGVELNQEYIKLAKKRINLEQGVFAL